MLFDPATANLTGVVAAAQDAIAAATLEIGTELQQLPLRVGDVVTATVLVPRDGADRLAIGGRLVRAVLPPEAVPGETLRLQVTAIDDDRVMVRMLGENETPPESTQPRGAPAAESTRAPGTSLTQPRVAQSPAPQRTSGMPNARRAANPPEAAPIGRRVVQAQTQPEAHAVEARIAFARAAAPIARTAARVAQAPPKRHDAPTARVPSSRARPGEPLLQRLQVPRTPVTLAAARIMDGAAKAVARAFERVDALLPFVTTDARVVSLKSVLRFVAHIDPANERALPERIAAFVSHVVDGPEPKIAALVRALQDDAPPALQTRAVVHAAELAHDAKRALLALRQSLPADAAPALPAALNDALTAATAVQLHALSAMTSDPTAVTFVLPAFYREDGQGATLRISRDAPHARVPLDGDNFRIGFVLDTASVGTLAIDVETVGRSVRVKVTTENASQARRVSQALPALGDRLERMRYHIASMRADAVPPKPSRSADIPDSANVDLRA